MRLGLWAICFFLSCILTLLAEQFNLDGWSSNLIGWIGGIIVGVVGVILIIDWVEKGK